MKQIILSLIILLLVIPTFSQEEEEGQSRESMAVDATATQWSYQFAYEGFFDYKDDIDPGTGVPRLQGRKGFLQFRFVAPIPKSDKLPVTLLPRLTLRAVQDSAGKYGFGSSDLFILAIAQQWKTGRWGIGPQVNFPSMGGYGNTNWGFGFAAAFTQRAWKDRLFFALLFQQTWSSRNHSILASPLSINPSFVLQLGKGFYVGNGDYVINYNWYTRAWLIPIGARFGKSFVSDKSTWNAYLEYAQSVYYSDWYGPIPGWSIRINVQFQIPLNSGK